MTRVIADRVGKKYRRYDPDRPWTLQEMIQSGLRRFKAREYFWSLRDVSFQVDEGKALGVVGRNGAGKSTLLRLLGRIGRPDEGVIRINGRLSGLLELTAGFHPDLTGRENALIGGVLRGLTTAEVRHRFEDIVEFSELAHCIDQPLRTFSSGMQMRLAFSVAIHARPDVLLVDEVLAVGDAAFQTRCLDRVSQMKADGCTIVLVSHDASLVEQMCEQALWLDKGKVLASGSADIVARDYLASLENSTVQRTVEAPPLLTSQGVVLVSWKNRFGSLEVRFSDVRLSSDSDPQGVYFRDGNALSVEMDYIADEALEGVTFGVTIVTQHGQSVFHFGSYEAAVVLPGSVGQGTVSVRISNLTLKPDIYFVEVGTYESQGRFAYDYHCRAYPLICRSPSVAMPPSGIARQ